MSQVIKLSGLQVVHVTACSSELPESVPTMDNSTKACLSTIVVLASLYFPPRDLPCPFNEKIRVSCSRYRDYLNRWHTQWVPYIINYTVSIITTKWLWLPANCDQIQTCHFPPAYLQPRRWGHHSDFPSKNTTIKRTAKHTILLLTLTFHSFARKRSAQ